MHTTTRVFLASLLTIPLAGLAAFLPDTLDDWSQTQIASKLTISPQVLKTTHPSSDAEVQRRLETATKQLLAKHEGAAAASAVIHPAVNYGASGNVVCVLSYAGTNTDVSHEFAAHLGDDDRQPLYLTATGFDPRPWADFNDAKEFVLDQVLHHQTTGREVVGWPEIIPTATVNFTAWRKSISPPGDQCWVFVTDDAPLANWKHPCRYIFVAPDLSGYVILYADAPLDLSEKTDFRTDVPLSPVVVVPFVPPASKAARPPDFKSLKAESGKNLFYSGRISNCYAVVISGGYNLGNNYRRYWGDSSFFYSTLTKKYGYLDAHIYALISDGTDPANDRNDGTFYSPSYTNSPTDLDGDGDVDTDYSATLASISNVFSQLAGILTTNDQLMVFTTDHGSPVSGYHVLINLWNEEELHDYDLKAMTTNLPCPVMFLMEQCYSGGFIDDLNQTNRVIATACSYARSSYSGDTYPYYDQYVYYWTAAVRGYFPGSETQPWVDGAVCTGADVNCDGYVSFKEASDYAYINRYYYNEEYYDDPQYNESPTNFGHYLFMTSSALGWIGLDVATLDFSGAYGGTNPAVSALNLTSVNHCGFAFSNVVAYGAEASGWLNLLPVTGTVAGNAAQSVVVAVNMSGLNAGTYTATNEVVSTNAHNSPQRVTIRLTVNKADQTITFAAISDQAIINAVGLSATASSGLPVGFSVGAGPGAITDGTNLSFTATGRVSIVAGQAGNSNWNAAPGVTNSFNVTADTLPTHHYADVDIDGDGKADLVIFDPLTGIWRAKLSGSGYAEASGILGGPGCILVPGDYDGDTRTDPGVYAESTGLWTVMLSSSGYGTASATLGGMGYAPVPSDYDGDRKTDLGVYQATTGGWTIKLSASGYAEADTTFGGANYLPVQRDYDGDAKADPAIYHLTTGDWRMMLSGSDYGIASAIGFGGTGYAPVVGDYDGDHLSDPAIYNESTGTWYVMLSGSGYLIATATLGGSGYTALPGDYDGDGLTDPGVYHTTTGEWYVMLSSSGYGIATATFGGEGYDPVGFGAIQGQGGF